MFAKRILFHGSALVEAQIVSSETPDTFPLTTDRIDNAGTGKKYRLGDESTWKETTI